MADRTKMWEETPGVTSGTRVVALASALGGFLVLVTCVVVAIRDGEHAAGIIAALAAASASAFAGSWAALRERTTEV